MHGEATDFRAARQILKAPGTTSPLHDGQETERKNRERARAQLRAAERPHGRAS